MSEYRLIRLGRQIQEEIGAMIVEGRIKDYRVATALSVTRVEVARDLAYADVYVSSYESSDRLERGVAGLSSAAAFIQGRLAAKMHIRQTPKLRFHVDAAMVESFDLVKKIEGLNA
jgi:ribosome-binding factor A